MYNIKFDTGETVSFQNKPTDTDIEEVVKKLGIKPKSASIPETSTQPSNQIPTKQPKSFSQNVSDVIGNLGAGVIKGGLSTLQNIGKPIGSLLNEAMPITSQDKLGLPQSVLQPQGTAQKIGSGAEKIAEFALPLSKVSKAVEGLPFLTKLLTRAGTAGAIATAQEGKIGTGTLLAAGTEGTLATAGKTFGVVKNLFRSLGAGLSGAPAKAIDAIIQNPSVARETAKVVDLTGAESVLQKNAQTILNGVSKVRQEARVAYGNAVGALKAEDINPTTFRNSVKPVLESVGSTIKNGKRVFSNAEFSDPKNIKIANTLINKLSTTPLDGYSLRSLLNQIDNSAYKVATSDERLAFNAFIRNLSDGVKSAISKSTDKLNEINKAYSSDLQLTNAIENIFGKVKFKNTAELNRVAGKLNTLFSKNDLSPGITDSFLTRIGIKPSDFRASEATRQISSVDARANAEGISLGEIMRAVTSSVITPKTIRDLSILTGHSENVLNPILKSLNPIARGAFTELLLNFGQSDNNVNGQ